MRRLLDPLTARLRHNFLLRWLVANVAGWVVALHLLGRASVSDHFIIVAAVGLTGMLAIGLAQWWVLGEHLNIGFWWVLGTVGALLASAVLNYFLTSFILYERSVHQTFQYLVMGGLIGFVLGAFQSVLLRRHLDRLGVWLVANLLGGASCAVISLPLTFPRSLLGAGILGLLTGYALIVMARATQTDTHHNPIEEYND